jgi:hypothetical protein
VLLSICSILIFANAEALLWPFFFIPWSLFFPWLIFVGPAGPFIVGVVLSLVIAGAIFLYMLGFRVLAAFLVLPTAILSLFIGGGFVVGLVLGVLTGLLMIMNGRPWH